MSINQSVELEASEAWQLARKICIETRKAVQSVSYEDHYVLATPAIQNATSLMSNIAVAVGKSNDEDFDYRYARGHLFALKSLLGAAHEVGYAKDTKAIMLDIDKLQTMLDRQLKSIADKKDIL